MIANDLLRSMRAFFDSGETKSYAFRRLQLQRLKNCIEESEAAIHAALYQDLKKSAEESFATETGFVIAEINDALKKLRDWMSPKRVATNLVNLPSRSKIMHEPLGVVLIIAPWNYPFQLLINPLVGAIAAGNCVALKPSELAPATSACISKIIASVFEPRYISVFEGAGATVIQGLMNSLRFDHIFYTGSTNVGRQIYRAAAEQLIPVTLELGGKSPCIVEADADLKVAAKRIVLGKFLNAGQTCIAPDYLLVHESVKSRLIEFMKVSIRDFYGEDAKLSNDYGKIINHMRFDKLSEMLKDGRIIHGGRSDREVLYIEPTIIEDAPLNSEIMSEEIFGPLLPVHSFITTEEAMAMIQLHPDPLAFYIFTSSDKRAEQWLSNVSFGGACVNNTAWHLANYHLPFGGIRNSGMGRYHGKHSFEVFTHAKAVLTTPTWFDPAIKYPPFKGRLGLFRWLFR
jgi:aldehyde dehydrogenase (NAD+)